MSAVQGAAGGPAVAADERVAKANPLRGLLVRPEMGAVAGAVVVWCYFALTAGSTGFLSMRGTASYLEVAAELGILAVAVSLLMIGGEFDLSIGSIIGAAGILIAFPAAEYGWNLWASMALALVFALLIGVLNGLLVVRTGLPSFIITLGTLFMVRGATIALTRIQTGRTNVGGLEDLAGYETARAVFASSIVFDTDGSPVSIVGELGRGQVGFAVSILWWVALAAVATYVLLRTPLGNWIFGIGGNLQAARNVGVPVNLVKILLFMGTAFAGWLVAVIQVINVKSADVLRGGDREFFAIIAVVIGGTLLTGGYGSAVGAVFGALIYGMVKQGSLYAGIDADWNQAVLGAMLVIAVLVNRFIRARAMGSRR